MQKIFSLYRVEEQAYKGCLSFLKLADKYTPKRLENACRIALQKMPYPRFKNIRLILEAGQDKKEEARKPGEESTSSNEYAIVRGASYYGGGSHEE